jgi:TonB family protein
MQRRRLGNSSFQGAMMLLGMALLVAAAPAIPSDSDTIKALVNLANVNEIAYRLHYQELTHGEMRIGATIRETAVLLRMGEAELIDPWGTPYRIDIRTDGHYAIIGAGADRKFDPPSWEKGGQFAGLDEDVVLVDGRMLRSNRARFVATLTDQDRSLVPADEMLSLLSVSPPPRQASLMTTPRRALGALQIAETRNTTGVAISLDVARAHQTMQSMALWGVLIDQYIAAHRSVPVRQTAEGLRKEMADDPWRMHDFLDDVDEWLTPFHFDLDAKARTYRIVSAGSDRKFDPTTWDLPLHSVDTADDIVLSNGRFVRSYDIEAAEEKKRAQPILAPGGPAYRVGGNVKAPVVIQRVDPPYPKYADGQEVSGIVIIEAVIDEQGNVTYARVIKGLGKEADESTVAALTQWKFQPGTIDGKPVKVLYTLTTSFQPK